MDDTKVYDCDSHFQEPVDWLAHADPELGAMVPPARLFDIKPHHVIETLISGMPRERADLAPVLIPDPIKEAQRTARQFATLEEAAAAFDEGLIPGLPAPYGAFKPEERVRCLDGQGIHRQIVNPAGALMTVERVVSELGQAVRQRVMAAYNSWAAQTLEGYTDRLLPTTLVTLDDPTWTVSQLTRMRERGSRSFLVKAEVSDRSPAHPDVDMIWSAAEDLGMCLILHFGWGRPRIDPGWYENGRGDVSDLAFLVGSIQPVVPQLFLGSLIGGGVLARHPELLVVVQEFFSTQWIEAWLQQLDSVPNYPQFRALTGPWRLPLTPREYAERHVRLCAQPGDDVRQGIDRVGKSWFVFGSDFPHPEGSTRAVDYFADQLAGYGPDVKEWFFSAGLAPVFD